MFLMGQMPSYKLQLVSARVVAEVMSRKQASQCAVMRVVAQLR